MMVVRKSVARLLEEISTSMIKDKPSCNISRTQTGYILKEKDAKNFNLYHNRIALGIAVAMLLMSLTSDWRISIIAGLVLFGVLQYRFVKSWLPTLPQIPNFKPKTEKVIH